jgi:hypothetical protein
MSTPGCWAERRRGASVLLYQQGRNEALSTEAGWAEVPAGNLTALGGVHIHVQ